MCFPLLRPYNKHKLEFRYAPCVFLGYCSNQHGYNCLDSSGRVYVSQHIKYYSNVFPCVDTQGSFIQSSTRKNTETSTPFFFPFNSIVCSRFDDNSVYPSVVIDRQPNDFINSQPDVLLNSESLSSTSASLV